jgi:four helix bundle protein
MKKARFNFEDLEVWQKAVDFAERIIKVCDKLDTGRKHYRIIEQLESSAASVSMNIAEGKGRYSKKEFVQFLHIAKGSLFETVTLLTIAYRNKWISEAEYDDIKGSAELIGRMISSLIGSIRYTIPRS